MVHIEQQIEIAAPIQRCFDLARSIEVHLLGAERSGERAVSGVTTGFIGKGESVRWRARHFGVWQHLTSKITAFDPPTCFQDTMTEGAFRFMRHDHLFSALADNRTVMIDRFTFAAPLPLVGPLAERLFLRTYMEHFLQGRNQVLKGAAESDTWQRFYKPLYAVPGNIL